MRHSFLRGIWAAIETTARQGDQEIPDGDLRGIEGGEGPAPSEKKKMVVEFLRNDSQARKAFIGKIAPTVMNKMSECGLIP